MLMNTINRSINQLELFYSYIVLHKNQQDFIMAYLDKMYGTYTEWCSLFSFLKEKKPEYVRYLYNPPPQEGKDHPLSNFSLEADMYLWENCPLEFVKNNLRRQYSQNMYKNILNDFCEVMNKVPIEELNKLSKDASKNLDDHLYEK